MGLIGGPFAHVPSAARRYFGRSPPSAPRAANDRPGALRSAAIRRATSRSSLGATWPKLRPTVPPASTSSRARRRARGRDAATRTSGGNAAARVAATCLQHLEARIATRSRERRAEPSREVGAGARARRRVSASGAGGGMAREFPKTDILATRDSARRHKGTRGLARGRAPTFPSGNVPVLGMLAEPRKSHRRRPPALACIAGPAAPRYDSTA
jgi:hypothetical protein